MHPFDPSVMTALVALCAGVLMLNAGLAKRQLSWRPRRTDSKRRRRR
jgi:hypothetical protein